MALSMQTRSAQQTGATRTSRKALRSPSIHVNVPLMRPALHQRPEVRSEAAAGGPAPEAQQDGFTQWFASIGLPTSEGIFGFRPFAETWCGRLAMMGFLTSIIEEFVTGRGTLAQMYLMEPGQPNYLVLGLLMAVFGGATIYGSVDTLSKIKNKKLSPRDIARYKNFLALNNENALVKDVEAAMKGKPDFTTPGNDMAAIAAAKAQGTPADAFLATNDVAQASLAAQQMKAQEQAALQGGEPGLETQGPAVSLKKRRDIEEEMMFGGDAERAYALSVEQNNGRWAMIGFLTAVLVEAGTGKGIIMQIIMWLKITGFLGAESGF